MSEKTYLDVEDLKVYRRLCELHLHICELTSKWPKEKKYELGSQIRRSYNSAPAQLAEKNDDRHIRNKVEGVNRARGETAETIHHLYIARLKGYLNDDTYNQFRTSYKECIRMLNGLERKLEEKLPPLNHRWNMAKEHSGNYYSHTARFGYPNPDTRNLKPAFLKSET